MTDRLTFIDSFILAAWPQLGTRGAGLLRTSFSMDSGTDAVARHIRDGTLTSGLSTELVGKHLPNLLGLVVSLRHATMVPG